MLNPHHKDNQAYRCSYEKNKVKELNPESSNTETGDPYVFQGPKDGMASPQIPTPSCEKATTVIRLEKATPSYKNGGRKQTSLSRAAHQIAQSTSRTQRRAPALFSGP